MKYIDKNKIYLDEEELFRHLDVSGKLIDKNYKPEISIEKLKEAYEYMVLSREQEKYMTQLQRQGRMLTFAPNFGEEALQVATAAAMEKEDWFVPAFRSNAAMLMHGVPLENMMVYWNGSEKGSKMPDGVNVLPVNIPIGTQFSHAAGIAYGMKLKGDKNVAVSFIGNGGTAEGEFYEALNISSIHKLPAVFCVNNNQWAISTPNKFETGSKTIAAKAVAAGIPGVRVDGNDLLASYDVISEAIKYAREGNGPILVEFVTWREGVHTSSDNPKLYRTAEAEKAAEKWEPFHRIEQYLINQEIMTQEEIDQLKSDKLDLAKATFKTSLTKLGATIDEVFDHTYENLTPELKEQKERAFELNEEENHG